MKILHVNMSLDSVTGGGTVERVTQLHKALLEQGCESRILSIDTHERGSGSSSSVSLLSCMSRRWFIPVPNLALVRQLVEWSDVVHLMNHWTIINVWVYLQAKRLGKPYIICPAGALNIFGRSKLKKYLFQKIIGKDILHNASALIAVSPDEIQLFRSSGVKLELIHHIANGVDERDFNYSDETLFRDKLGIGSSPYILFLGRLNLIKGPDLLLSAFAKQKGSFPHQLVFAGPEDGMGESLQKQVADLGLADRVIFAGHVEGDLKSSAYHGASILAIPSRHEAMSIVALEAAISKKAVLLTQECGFSELVDVGAAVEVPATVDGLSQGLQKILVQEGEKLKDMGEQGYSYAQNYYSWRIISRRLLDICNSIK